MLLVSKHLPRGRGLAPALVRRAAYIALDWDTRQKSRFSTTDSSGRELALVLPRGTVLRGGDVLLADDGSLVAVQAAAQAVLRVTADAPLGLLRAAYHLGNRHVALQIGPGWLRYLHDHVLDGMARELGLEVDGEQAPFEPEVGAYGGGHHHHGHDD